MRTFKGESWTVQDLEDFWEVIDGIGQEWGITYPPTQIEILSADQMVETISTIGAPCSYDHWSIGKKAIELHKHYESGTSGLALELIINSDPTIMYIAENNTLIQQGLVLAHAGIGHGSVFKNNHLFKQWTHADSILDYMSFARDYIKECEIKHSPQEVENLLDMCHALQDFGISHHKRKKMKDHKTRHELLSKENQAVNPNMLNDKYKGQIKDRLVDLEKGMERRDVIHLPEENILYFLEKHSSKLETWQREILRINRKIAEYFYPQRKTKIVHEGWATFIEKQVFDVMYERGNIDEGGYLEFIRDHSSVIYQPDHDSKHYSGSINPYAIGFAIFNDLYRMTKEPTMEDWKRYPEICETDWTESLVSIITNYSDEDFISRYLTPNVIKRFKFFAIDYGCDSDTVEIMGTAHDEDKVRESLSASLNMHNYHPLLSITSINEENQLIIEIEDKKGKNHDEQSLRDLGWYISQLWGNDVFMYPKDTSVKSK